jgi:aspartate ammonia-lyase
MLEAQRRLKECIQKLGITEDLIKKKQDLDAFVSAMAIDKLAADKKKVKNELRMYDNDFQELFHNPPNHDEK